MIQSQLLEKIDQLESELPLNREKDIILENSRKDLDDITAENTRGIIFRSKCKWYHEGEQSTKYFLNLEKARYNSKTCESLVDGDIEVFDQKQIMSMQFDFYSKLYQSDKKIEFQMEGESDVRIDEELKSQQEQPFTAENVASATKSLKNEKTPGPDGIPVDLYKIMWKYIKDPLMNMIEYCYEQKIMPVTTIEGVLNLIPKPKKDSRLLQNLRPITLLNADYKIIEKAISNKMKVALDQIISKDQTGFMKNRRISANIRKVFDLIHHCEQNNIPAQVLCCDFIKCFDRIEKTCILNSLRYFNFADYIIEWVDLLYTDFTVKIQNNGHFTPKIRIERSVHQGGACSAELFLCCVEILAKMLKNNDKIKGVTIKEITHLLDQFADDLDVTSLHDMESMNEILNTFQKFHQISGFKLSYEKTSIYRIGSIRNTNAEFYTQDIKWTNNPINILGVLVCSDPIECIKINYENIVVKIKDTLSVWNKRNLSLHGKITVINVLMASIFVYKMCVLPSLPSRIIKNINNEIVRFLWSGRKAKIPLNILQGPKSTGGLNLVDLRLKDISIKCTWIQILENDEKLANLAYSQMDEVITSDIWRANLQGHEIDSLFPHTSRFWKDVMKAWSSIKYTSIEESKVENEILWWNSHIRIGNSPIRWRIPYERGLLWVHQLYEKNKLISIKEAKERYGLSYIQLYSLDQAIPQAWKEQIRAGIHKFDLDLYETLVQKQNLARYISKELRNKIHIEREKVVVKWEIELECDLGDMYIKAFKDLYCTTNVPKYRSFQYRLLHRAIITNVHLYRWKMINSNICTFCKNEKETYVHLFYMCPVVQEIWTQFPEIVKEFTTEKLTLSSKNVMLNSIVLVNRKNIANFICLMFKQYVYRQRCFNKCLSLYEFKTSIWKVRNFEKFYAIKNNKEDKFNKKWHMCNNPQT